MCPGTKNVSDFVQKYSVSATNVSQFAQPKKHHGQQYVRTNVSSFTRAFTSGELRNISIVLFLATNQPLKSHPLSLPRRLLGLNIQQRYK